VAVHALLVEIPTVVAAASNPDPSMGEGGLQANLDAAVGANARSMDSKVGRIMPEKVAATWEVHRLREILLSTAAQVLGYSEKPITQKRSSHSCLIIEILT
jgi:hypothetical protein